MAIAAATAWATPLRGSSASARSAGCLRLFQSTESAKRTNDEHLCRGIMRQTLSNLACHSKRLLRLVSVEQQDAQGHSGHR